MFARPHERSYRFIILYIYFFVRIFQFTSIYKRDEREREREQDYFFKEYIVRKRCTHTHT